MSREQRAESIAIGSVSQDRIGPIWVAMSPKGLVGLHMKTDEEGVRAHYSGHRVEVGADRVEPVLKQLTAYFDGKQREFDVNIDWSGLTSFQQQVLRLVLEIPYGQTRTYQEIAQHLGNAGAARAVGRANATNPMPIVIPCHRVLGADGSLHGYGGYGGVETKAWLLKLEGSRLL